VLLLVVPVLVGLGIRLAYLWTVHRGVCPAAWWDGGTVPPGTVDQCPGDSYVYHYGANLLADGQGFVVPTDFRVTGGEVARAYADHPPLFTLFLAAFSILGMSSWTWHEHVVVLLGCVNIVLAGELGRRVAGPWVGFGAAMLMAVYPYVWLSDVMVMSETLAMTANLVVALLCYRVLRDHRWGWAVALGAAAGAAALVRAEMVLLGPLLILPMLLRIRSLSFRQQVGRIAVAAVAMVAVIAPWLFRNLTLFNNPVTFSSGTGITLANTNCDDTYYTAGIGFWSFRCIPPLPWNRPEAELRDTDAETLRLWVEQSGLEAPEDATTDELVAVLLAHGEQADQSDDEIYLRNVGTAYVQDNLGRLPRVMAVRFGRMWGLYRPLQQLELEDGEGRPEPAARYGLAMFYPIMVAAIGGAAVLARRRQPLLPLLVPIGIVTFAAVSAFGQSRYRAPAEPLLMVLASVGVVAAVGWLRARGSEPDEPARADEQTTAV